MKSIKCIFSVFRSFFHIALKKIIHEVVINCQQILFRYYISVDQSRYFKRVMKKKNHLTKLYLLYLKIGYHMCGLFHFLNNHYDSDFMDNNIDIIIAKIPSKKKMKTKKKYFSTFAIGAFLSGQSDRIVIPFVP